MNPSIHSSGFLYNLDLDQIFLLQRDPSIPESLALFSDKCHSHETPVMAFQRLIKNELDIDIPIHQVHNVYDYYSSDLNSDNFVTFAEIPTASIDALDQKIHVKTFLFKQLFKLQIPKQVRQDLVVGQRVIAQVARQRYEDQKATLPDEA